MKKNSAYTMLLVSVFFILLNATAICAERQSSEKLIEGANERRISMDFQNASLKDILKIFSQQAGLNFIASQQIQDRTVTLYLEDVSVKDALDKLLAANNLSYDLHNNIFIVKEWGAPVVETLTKVIPLRYARVSNSPLAKEISEKLATGTPGTIMDSLKEILTSNGKIVEDPRLNSIVITDVPSQFPLIEQLIKDLDVSTPLILVEVEMIDVDTDAVEKLGVDWPSTMASLDTKGSRVTSFPFSFLSGSKANETPYTFSSITTPSEDWTFESLDGSKFAPSVLTVFGHKFVLDFYKQQSDTKFLARPRILTLANETAEINLTANETVGTVQSQTSAEGSATTTTGAERYETGVSLRFTPQVNMDKREITMFLEPKISETRASNLSTSFRDPEDRGTKSVVRIKDGETIMIGGLLRTRYASIIKKVPFLGDIPILGWLFKHKNVSRNDDRELIVFLTPHIVEDHESAGIAKLETRESAKLYEEELDREQPDDNTRKDAIDTALKRWER